jgi:hypothetical protein
VEFVAFSFFKTLLLLLLSGQLRAEEGGWMGLEKREGEGDPGDGNSCGPFFLKKKNFL